MINYKAFVLGAALSACCLSCVTVNETLGEAYIPTYVKYDTYTADIYLDDVITKDLDSLSGYSSNRFVVGSIKDKNQGIIKKSCAFTLVPTTDTLDFGEDPEVTYFYLSALKDTVSVCQDNQANIMQNLNVYELEERVKSDDLLSKQIKHGTTRITDNIPVLTKDNDLYFAFSKEFREKYMNVISKDLHSKTGIDSIGAYLDKLPGIYMETDDPVNYGGRLNFFDIQLMYSGTTANLLNNYAIMGIRTKYNGVQKDTTFQFYFGAVDFVNLDSLSRETKVGYLPEYCLNMTKEEFKSQGKRAGEKATIAGGAGSKIVIGAEDLRKKILEVIASKGVDPESSEFVINKATLTLKYEFPENHEDMSYYPAVLSPTTRISKSGYVQYASLTDANTDKEDIGSIDRSRNCYSPDITYHIQTLAKLDPENVLMSNYDIWMLILANESRQTSASTQAETDSMNQYMQYMQWYSMMYCDAYGYGGYGGYGMGGYGYGYGGYGYGYGYGGYGYGYGGYGYGNYSNYYLYSMMSSMSGSTVVNTQELDIDRYYNATIYGPDAEQDKRPVLHLTYSIPKE